MVTTDDEVRRAEVLADDRVPERLAGTGHAHRKREKGEVAHSVRVLRHDSLIHTHTGVMVDVTGLGEADDRVDKDIGLALAGGADSELTVSTVHRVAGLEGDDLAPSELLEVCAELSRGVYGII